MRRRDLAIFVGVAAVAAAAVLGKSCLNRGDTAGPTASSTSGSAGPSAARPGPRAPQQKPAGPAGSAAAPGDAPQGAVVISAPWGSQLGQLGRERPSEGNPEAPMSFAVDAKGRVLVVDQVNSRVVRYGPDGKPEAALPVELRTAQDIALADDGTMAVMDRYTEKSVELFDESGKPIGDLPLVGEGVEQPGDLTGVFVDGKDVYVERQHGPLVRIGDTAGNAAQPRSEIPGRPSRDGLSFLNAGIIEAPAGRAYVSSTERATMQHRFTRELRLDGHLLTIVLLDTDRSGVIYFAVQMRPQGSDDEVVMLTCLEPLKGQPIGTAAMPGNTMPELTFRDLAVLDGGGVIYAHHTETGVTYQRYDCE